MVRPQAVKLWHVVTNASRQQSTHGQSRFFSNPSIRQPALLKLEDKEDPNVTLPSSFHLNSSSNPLLSSSTSSSSIYLPFLLPCTTSASTFQSTTTSFPSLHSNSNSTSHSQTATFPFTFIPSSLFLSTKHTVSNSIETTLNLDPSSSSSSLPPPSANLQPHLHRGSKDPLPNSLLSLNSPSSSSSSSTTTVLSSPVSSSPSPWVNKSLPTTMEPTFTSSNAFQRSSSYSTGCPTFSFLLSQLPSFSNQLLHLLQLQKEGFNTMDITKDPWVQTFSLSDSFLENVHHWIELFVTQLQGLSLSEQRAFCFEVLTYTLQQLQMYPIPLSRLQVIAQRLFATLSDLDGLRQWKKMSFSFMTQDASSSSSSSFNTSSSSTPSLPSTLPSPPSFSSHPASCLPSFAVSTPSLYPPKINGFTPMSLSPPSTPTQKWTSPSSLSPDHLRSFLKEQSRLLLTYVQKGQTHQARALFASLTAQKYTPIGEATHAYLNMLAKDNQLELALSEFQLLEHIETETTPWNKLQRHHYFLYNAMISACCTAHHASKALQFYTMMKERLHQLPDLKTFTKLFTLLAKQKQWLQTMVQLLHDLHNHGVTPYPLLFNLTLSQCVLNDQLDQANCIFQKMVQWKVPPTAVTYSTLMKGALNQHQLSLAEFYFDHMVNHPLNQSSAFMNSMGPFHALLQYYVLNQPNPLKVKQIYQLYQSNFDQFVSPTGFTFYLLVLSCMQHPCETGLTTTTTTTTCSSSNMNNNLTSSFPFHLLSSSLQAQLELALTYLRDMVKNYPPLHPSHHHFVPLLQALYDHDQQQQAISSSSGSIPNFHHFVLDIMQSEFKLNISIPEAYDLIQR